MQTGNTRVVISGAGLFTPAESVSNHELVESFNAWVDHYNAEHADAIADMALANFIEMRDHTASRGFRLRKKLERILHRVLGRRFVPLYEMVSFTLIPYADARRRARRQWRLAISGGLGLMLMIVVGAIIILT